MKLIITESQVKKLVENTLGGEPRIFFTHGKDNPNAKSLIERTKKIYHALRKGSASVIFLMEKGEDEENGVFHHEEVKFHISYELPPIEEATFQIDFANSNFDKLQCNIYTHSLEHVIKFKITNWNKAMNGSGQYEYDFIKNNYGSLVHSAIAPRFKPFGINFAQ
jgi:hypothetical protein